LRDPLCKDCRKLYGNRVAQWPEFVREWVRAEQRDLNRERRHDFDLPFFDESYVDKSKYPFFQNIPKRRTSQISDFIE
jgi:hypothetical protein